MINKYLLKDSISQQSWCKLYEGDKEVKDIVNADCFSGYLYYPELYKKVTLVKQRFPVEVSCFSEKEIIRYIQDLNEMGFLIVYKGIHHNNYYFDIPFDDSIKYKGKMLYIASVLTLVRYLYHRNITCLVDYYLQIIDELGAKADKFSALQLAHFINPTYNYGNYNHTVLPFYPQKAIAKEEFFKKIEKEHPHTKAAVAFNWGSHKTYKSEGKTIEEKYKEIL